MIWYSEINYDQFTVLCANTCQFYKFTCNIFKILNFLKVLKITACFGQYGHPQVLKSSGGNCCYSAVIVCALPMRTCVVLGVSCSLLFSVVCLVLNILRCSKWSYFFETQVSTVDEDFMSQRQYTLNYKIWINNVACTAVAMQRPQDKANKQLRFLGKSSVNNSPRQRIRHKIGELCILCASWREVITRTVGAMRQLSSAREAEKCWRYNSVELRVVGYSPDSNNVCTESEEYPLLRSVTRKRLVRADWLYLACALVTCELWKSTVAL
jgi:hypothetical protein